MFRLDRARVMPVVLRKKKSLKELASKVGLTPRQLWDALNGAPVEAEVIGRLSHSWLMNAHEYLQETAQVKEED